MSFGAGGLAQMTYNHNSLNGGINNGNMPASNGLASRGANMKRLSIMTPAPSDEVAQAPKSSRAQLLAGLRTAPKNAAGTNNNHNNNNVVPGTAPATQSQFPVNRRQPSPPNNSHQQQGHLAVPQTAMASSFAQAQAGPRGHRYTPSQVMSPPAITLEAEEAEQAQLDPAYYQQLLAMNQHLAQQQERLKQQLVMVTQQAQQMGLSSEQAQYYAQMMAQQAGLYNQQMQQGPVVEPVANQPGLFMVYNPMTGQTQYVYDQNAAQADYAAAAAGMGMGMNMADQTLSHSPPPATPTYKTGFEPTTQNHARSNNWRSSSPPKHSPSPPREEPMALPPPSANAYRPGHKKTASTMPGNIEAAPKTAGLNGNFGPGQNREGEHPIRQPRGPPALDELVAKPTSRIEGSKNFASRQRRAALNNIISAAGARRSCSNSNASLSPTSERDELVFSSSAEDNDTASIRSGGSSTQRAIGSEKKEREERESRERERKNSSSSSEESLAEKLNALNMGVQTTGTTDSREKRRSAVLLMKGAGQRRSMMY